MKKLYFILLVILLYSCKESIVQFSEPQPEHKNDMKSFPGKLIGNYYNSENETDLEITKYFIIKKILVRDTINRKELSEFEVLNNDTIINKKTSEKIIVKKLNDSLFTNYVYTDTIFRIDDENVLRKFKGYYFLNFKTRENNWSVKKLFQKNGQLNINDITTKEEIELLEEIIETKKDSTKPFVIKPTKQQFREFLKRNGFKEGEIYLKR